MQTPVDHGRVGQQVVVYVTALRSFDNAQVRVFNGFEIRIRNAGRKAYSGLTFEQQSQLKSVIDQFHVDMGNLQPALRDGAQQALGFQARDQLAHRAQRHAQQLHGAHRLRHESVGSTA